MKINKNFIALFIIAAMGFVLSCEENVAEPINEASGTSILGDSTMTADWQEFNVNDLPQNVSEFVQKEFSDKEIKEAWLTDEGEYIVVLGHHLYLIFDNEGNFIEVYKEREHRGDRDPIDVSQLPQSVLDYLAANHADIGIKKAFVNEDGEYIIKLKNRMVVVFDADGNFIEEFEKERRKHRGRFFDDWSKIEASELPQAVLQYIETEHPGAEIVIAGTNEKGGFGVILDTAILLLFDAEGGLIEELSVEDLGRAQDYEKDWTEVAIDDLPQAIRDYIVENYPDATASEAWFSEDEEVFVIELSSEIYLVFDAEGNFIEEAEEEDKHGRREWTEIDAEELPQAAKDYLAENHADASIEEAFFDEEHQKFIVELSTDVYVIFDAEGKHIKTRACDD